MSEKAFIQIILPLKLAWEPYYAVEQGQEARVGDRVKVRFAHREYIGVVSAVGVDPAASKVDTSGVKTAAVVEELPRVSTREIKFWRKLSEYYLCTVGEVFKAACPADRKVVRKPKKKSQFAGETEVPEIVLSPSSEAAVKEIREAFKCGKTALLKGEGRTELYLSLARDVLREGRSVLLLVPEIALSRQVEERVKEVFPSLRTYHSEITPAAKRLVAREVREGAGMVIGTRSALFLPFRDLGLIIVDQEEAPSFKQDSPAPRYGARESSIMLAAIHGANVLLGSATPSLETLYNSDNKLFARADINQSFTPETTLINTAAEVRKNGMSGSFSLRLLALMRKALGAGGKVLLVCRSKASVPETEEEIGAIFPGEGIELIGPAGIRTLEGTYSLVGVLQADGILGKEDFRSDEHTLQLLQQLRGHCRDCLAIQTREPRHPVFRALAEGADAMAFLEERRAFGYPPFRRLVKVVVRDGDANRLLTHTEMLSRRLGQALGDAVQGPLETREEDTREILVFLPRNRELHRNKLTLYKTVEAFELEYHSTSRITIDVDPV